jgi:uncharacterized protein YmfQ (DUF2313 family)
MPIPNWSVADFLAQFLQMLPRGRAWSRLSASVAVQSLGSLMPTYVRSASAAAGLLVDGFPATTDGLVPEWNASLGLPDSCTPAAVTLQQQQAAIVEKFTRGGNMSVAYYYHVAALFGWTITIVEGAPETRTWTIHAPASAPPSVFRAGGNRAGDLLETIQNNSQLECVFNKIKPADTVLVFSFP